MRLPAVVEEAAKFAVPSDERAGGFDGDFFVKHQFERMRPNDAAPDARSLFAHLHSDGEGDEIVAFGEPIEARQRFDESISFIETIESESFVFDEVVEAAANDGETDDEHDGCHGNEGRDDAEFLHGRGGVATPGARGPCAQSEEAVYGEGNDEDR